MRYAEAGVAGEGAIRQPQGVPSSVLGVIVFIVAEAMFFIGLISAFTIAKANSVEWPPADMPTLPLFNTALNTAVLLVSGVVLYFAVRAFAREGKSTTSNRLFLLALGLGTFFVVFQGYEWATLISFGLTVQSSLFGGFFYLIIGAHAVHAVGSILAQLRLYYLFRKGKLRLDSFKAGAAFWYFVVGLWPLLYFLVYFA